MPRIREDHAHEQFFFSEGTCARLVALASQYRRPLLLCTPSIAVALDAQSRPYILLDRDRRFAHLSGYQRFDLRAPHMIFEDFDAIFVDPPFSNISLEQLAGTVDALARCAPTQPDLYLCYINTREEELLRRFGMFSLRRHPGALGYRSVKASTQARIFLYGPLIEGSPARSSDRY